MGIIEFILGFYRDNGKEDGNCYSSFHFLFQYPHVTLNPKPFSIAPLIRLAGLAQKAADAEAGRSEVKRTTPTLPSPEVL